MRRNYYTKILFLMCFLILSGGRLRSQLSISGPACVTLGTTYLYDIGTGTDSATIVRICVTGGKLSDSNIACIKGEAINAVKITWDEGTTTGSISVSSSLSNSNLNVNITKPLDAGTINLGLKAQIRDTLTLPSVITCTPASGGHCSPIYSYQWQQSDDALKWIDIPGSSGLILRNAKALRQTTYYRRKVTEVNSGSIDYSDVASVSVNIYGN